jgi:hypothetical protein
VCMCVYASICVHTLSLESVWMDMCSYTKMRMHECLRMHALYVSVCMYIYIYIYIYMLWKAPGIHYHTQTYTQRYTRFEVALSHDVLRVYMHVCINVHTYLPTYEQTHAYQT